MTKTAPEGQAIVCDGRLIGISYNEEDTALMMAVHVTNMEKKAGGDGWVMYDSIPNKKVIKKLVKRGLMEINGNLCRPTEAGYHKMEGEDHA